ncbi:MAG: hypothetical protein ACREYA_23965 [Cupriavidus necator]
METKESDMPNLSLCALALSLGLLTMPVQATQAHVNITAPTDGATLSRTDVTKLEYEVQAGPKGDHVHVYVDGKEVAILQKLKGTHTLSTLSPGRRTICIKVVNSAHVPIGVEQCINVEVQ